MGLFETNLSLQKYFPKKVAALHVHLFLVHSVIFDPGEITFL